MHLENPSFIKLKIGGFGVVPKHWWESVRWKSSTEAGGNQRMRNYRSFILSDGEYRTENTACECIDGLWLFILSSWEWNWEHVDLRGGGEAVGYWEEWGEGKPYSGCTVWGKNTCSIKRKENVIYNVTPKPVGWRHSKSCSNFHWISLPLWWKRKINPSQYPQCYCLVWKQIYCF